MLPAFVTGIGIVYASRLILRVPFGRPSELLLLFGRATITFLTPGYRLTTPVVSALVGPMDLHPVMWHVALLSAVANGIAYVLVWWIVGLSGSGHRWLLVPVGLAILAWAAWNFGPPIFWLALEGAGS